MAACTGLQSKPSNSFKYSLFQHLSVNDAPSLMLNTESKMQESLPSKSLWFKEADEWQRDNYKRGR